MAAVRTESNEGQTLQKGRRMRTEGSVYCFGTFSLLGAQNCRSGFVSWKIHLKRWRLGVGKEEGDGHYYLFN